MSFKHFLLFAVLFVHSLGGYAAIDMQAHVASDEGKAAYTTYVSKQSAYYTGNYTFANMITQTGNTLFGTINTLMGNTCLNGNNGYSYDALRTEYVNVDRDLNNSSKIIGYYDGSSFSGTWDSGKTWNREHTWPQSKFKGTTNSSGTGIPIGYDMQSVRPASTAVNSGRGNTAYGEGSDYYDPNEISINNSNYKSSNNGTYRGDCARVILYDYVVYGKWGSYSNSLYRSSVTADLLTQIGTNSNSVFESLTILLKWHMQDPPSLTEMVRNDGGQDYQGNRNVFIDYPELAINMLKDQSGVTTYPVIYNITETASPAYTYTTPYGFVTYLTNSGGTHPGTVTVSGASYTYEASLGRLTISNVTGTVTITTSTSSVTYPITWSVDGVTSTTQVNEGSIPSAPSVLDCSADRVFKGWTTNSSVSGLPTPLYASSAIPVATSSATYYAVYADKHTSSSGVTETTVSMTSFSTIQGYVAGDQNVSYVAEKGNAGTAPVVNSNQIRIYQNGGLLTITANNSQTLKSVTIGSAMGTTVTYAVDGGSASANQSISAGNTFTINNLNATSVVFTCTGTTTSTRLYLNNLSVTYSGVSTTTTYDGYSTSCTPGSPVEVTATFINNGSNYVTRTGYAGTAMSAVEDPTPCDGYTFEGWSTSQYATINIASPEFANISTMPSANTTYYAVYSKTVIGGSPVLTNNYRRITSTDDLTDGNYVITGNSAKALKAEILSSYYMAVGDVSPVSDVISNPSANIIWRITNGSNGISFYNESVSQYLALYQSGTHYNLKLQSDANWFTPTVTGGNWSFESNDCADYYMVYTVYNNSTHEFAAKTSSTYTIQVYKQQNESPSTTYHTTSPDCTCTVTVEVLSANTSMGTVSIEATTAP